MKPGMIFCEDTARLDQLVELVQTVGREQQFGFEPSPSVEVASSLPSRATREVQCVYYVAPVTSPGDESNDRGKMEDEIDILSATFPGARILVELPQDSPDDAFAALRQGAFNVIAAGIRAWDLREVISYAIVGEYPYPIILKTKRPHKNWGLMSMSFDPGNMDSRDYRRSIKPTMSRLGLDLRRIDEIPYNNGTSDLRQRIQEEIRRREVLVAQISSLTPNTMYEIGFADALPETTILWLRRNGSLDKDNDPWQTIPSVLRGFFQLQYSTMTELAMRLFWGLQGTRADLHETPATED